MSVANFLNFIFKIFYDILFLYYTVGEYKSNDSAELTVCSGGKDVHLYFSPACWGQWSIDKGGGLYSQSSCFFIKVRKWEAVMQINTCAVHDVTRHLLSSTILWARRWSPPPRLVFSEKVGHFLIHLESLKKRLELEVMNAVLNQQYFHVGGQQEAAAGWGCGTQR